MFLFVCDIKKLFIFHVIQKENALLMFHKLLIGSIPIAKPNLDEDASQSREYSDDDDLFIITTKLNVKPAALLETWMT